jgi:hypothetical protein
VEILCRNRRSRPRSPSRRRESYHFRKFTKLRMVMGNNPVAPIALPTHSYFFAHLAIFDLQLTFARFSLSRFSFALSFSPGTVLSEGLIHARTFPDPHLDATAAEPPCDRASVRLAPPNDAAYCFPSSRDPRRPRGDGQRTWTCRPIADELSQRARAARRRPNGRACPRAGGSAHRHGLFDRNADARPC